MKLVTKLCTFVAFIAMTASAQVAVKQMSGHAETDVISLRPYVEIINEGNEPVELSELVIDYYVFEEKLSSADLTWEYYDGNSAGNVYTLSFFDLDDVYEVDGKKANIKCEISFTTPHSLNAGESLKMQYGIFKSGWNYTFSQSDDWSYSPSATYSYNEKIVVKNYSSGEVLYGTDIENGATPRPYSVSVNWLGKHDPQDFADVIIKEGDAFLNTIDHKSYVYYNGTWTVLTDKFQTVANNFLHSSDGNGNWKQTPIEVIASAQGTHLESHQGGISIEGASSDVTLAELNNSIDGSLLTTKEYVDSKVVSGENHSIGENFLNMSNGEGGWTQTPIEVQMSAQGTYLNSHHQGGIKLDRPSSDVSLSDMNKTDGTALTTKEYVDSKSGNLPFPASSNSRYALITYDGTAEELQEADLHVYTDDAQSAQPVVMKTIRGVQIVFDADDANSGNDEFSVRSQTESSQEELLKLKHDGTAKLPNTSIADINRSTKSITTKEYVDTKIDALIARIDELESKIPEVRFKVIEGTLESDFPYVTTEHGLDKSKIVGFSTHFTDHRNKLVGHYSFAKAFQVSEVTDTHITIDIAGDGLSDNALAGGRWVMTVMYVD